MALLWFDGPQTVMGSIFLLWLVLAPLQIMAQDGKRSMVASFLVEPGLTCIIARDSSIYIDYTYDRIYHKTHGPSECVSYSLSVDQSVQDSSDSRSQAAHKRALLFTSIEKLTNVPMVYTGDSAAFLFGSQALRFKKAAPPKLLKYGLIFQPGRVDYLVDTDHKLRNELLEVARKNHHYYERYPLLQQVDMLGLIPFMDGVPKKSLKDKIETIYSYQLFSKDVLRNNLMKDCKTR